MKIKIPIVFSTDHNYIIPTCVAIKSMLDVSKDVFCDIKILHGENLGYDDKDIIKDIINNYEARVEFINMGGEAENGFEVRNISISTYYRLFIPTIFSTPPLYEKIIYCDGDIVFKDSVKKLYNQDIRGFCLGAAPISSNGIYNRKFANYCKRIDVDYYKYINAGILLININEILRLGIQESLISLIGKKFKYQDQDIINIVCQNKIKFISPQFNYSSNYPLFRNFDNVKPSIIHYIFTKPWKEFSFFWNDWWSVYRSLPIYDYEKEIILSKRIIFPKIISFNSLKRILKEKVVYKH